METPHTTRDDVLVDVRGVSKKFSRNLKSSLRYGVLDLASSLLCLRQDRTRLRPDEFWAVRDVSLRLKRGECLGLIGHNGAGKSTLLKMLNGLIKPDTGEIRMRGTVGALIELGAGFNPVLTGRENIYINGQVLGFSKREIDDRFEAIVEFSGMSDFLDTPVQNYSSGMKVRLGFSVAAQMEPDVLIIDEVLAVGDLAFRMKCYTAIGRILQKASVIFVSHSMPLIARMCNEVIFMKNGRCNVKTNQVSEGISLYYNESGSAGKTNVGSGKLTVDNFRFVNAPGTVQDIQLYRDNHDIEFAFDVCRKHAAADSAVLKIEIWNQEMRPTAEVVPVEDNVVKIPDETCTITVRIPRPPLVAGKYSLTIAMRDSVTGEVFTRVGNISEFIVENRVHSTADILLPCSIRY